MAALARLGPDALDAAGRRRAAIFMQQGITFEVAGSDGERRDRAWPLDLVPRVLTSAEWTTIKRGLAQRIRALVVGPDQVSEPVWVGVDPTNRVLAGETHVKIGHGRHYADVPPIKGVYRGAATAKLDASVTMTRLERTDPASIARS
jgi:hypothetical protein